MSTTTTTTTPDGKVSTIRLNAEDEGDDPEAQPLMTGNQETVEVVGVCCDGEVKKTIPYTEHDMTIEELNDRFRCRINPENSQKSFGLTNQDVVEMMSKYGSNELNPPPSVPLWLLFLQQFGNLFMILLLVAAGLCIMTYIYDPSDASNLFLGFFLILVVIVTCWETFSQEAKADELMEKFRALVPEDATVIRDGVQSELPVSKLVVGDVVVIQSGQKVPADCRIFSLSNFRVDQSSITGEAEPVECQVDKADDKPLESKNLIFSGGLAVDGQCMAVVIRTGDQTYMGGMVGLTSDVDKESTNLKKDIEYFVLIITIFSLIQATIVLIIGLARGLPLIVTFIQGFVVIIVANIPQGLPTTVVTCLHIIAERMIAQNVFVKKLDVIETLGACSCICTDKTGTLTMNVMTVNNSWMMGDSLLKGIGYSSEQIRKELMNCAILNSRVTMEQKKGTEDMEMELKGDATELGLYRFIADIIEGMTGENAETYRNSNRKVHEIPFNSSNKWQLTIHQMADQNGKEVMYLKGAPDVLLSKCKKYYDNNGMLRTIDSKFMASYKEAYEHFGGQGERVLAFACKNMTGTVEDAEGKEKTWKKNLTKTLQPGGENTDFNFVGLLTLIDPARPEVPGAVEDCHKAGVKVVMVTGDHPITAAAIAKNIGLITLPTRLDIAKSRGIAPEEVPEDDVEAAVVHGLDDIPSMNEDDWTTVLQKQEVIFARTSPEQKLTIVDRFTAAGYLTAMTGDGVNDSPALKKAAVGIAMGQNGSDVAREAADIILLDDNFASIVSGIKEGRLLFANLKKSIAYTLTHTLPEVAGALVYILLAWPLPTTAILLLCIDLLTELLPAMSLAYEHPENNIMNMKPRIVSEDRLISMPLLAYSYFQAGLIITICTFTAYFLAFDYFGISSREVAEFDGRFFTDAPVGDYVSYDGHVFTEERQIEIMSIIHGTYYLSIVMCQAVHIWTCRTMFVSIFEHGLFSNEATNVGVPISVAIGLAIVYFPPFQYLDGAGGALFLVVVYITLMSIAMLFGWTEFRKWVLRTYPDSDFAATLRW